MTTDPAMKDLMQALYLLQRALINLNITTPPKIVFADKNDCFRLSTHVAATVDLAPFTSRPGSVIGVFSLADITFTYDGYPIHQPAAYHPGLENFKPKS
jgi:hypothetical protein